MIKKKALKRAKNFINVVKDFVAEFGPSGIKLDLNSSATVIYDENGNIVFLLRFYPTGHERDELGTTLSIYEFE